MCLSRTGDRKNLQMLINEIINVDDLARTASWPVDLVAKLTHPAGRMPETRDLLLHQGTSGMAA
jgi:hypothetical protein